MFGFVDGVLQISKTKIHDTEINGENEIGITGGSDGGSIIIENSEFSNI